MQVTWPDRIVEFEIKSWERFPEYWDRAKTQLVRITKVYTSNPGLKNFHKPWVRNIFSEEVK